MAEETQPDPFPDLKELESKTGRKIPESLLICMRDAAECEDSWRSDAAEREDQTSACDTFIDKINNLKQQMRWLRTADVSILRQLVAVHEGIEAMRWLMEERGTLTSRGSSLTGSLSSLATVDEHGPSMSPFRGSPSPICDQDLTETKDEELTTQQLAQSDSSYSNHQRYLDVLRMKSCETRNVTLSRSKQDRLSFIPSKNLNVTTFPKPEEPDSGSAPDKNTKDDANVVKRALLRSNKSRREQDSATSSEHQSQDSFTTSQTTEEEDVAQCKEKLLLGYDAQWRWVESQDDVTFL